MGTLNTDTSIVDSLKSKGQNSDFASRANLYESSGLGKASEYVGSSDQNVGLLKYANTGSFGVDTPVTSGAGNPVNPGGTGGAPVTPGDPQTAFNIINQNQSADFNNASSADEVPTRTPFQQEFDEKKNAIDSVITSENPAPVDYVADYNAKRAQYGVTDLENSLNDLTRQENDLNASKRTSIQAEMGKPVAMNVIQGRVSEQERNWNERIDAVQRQKSYVQNQLKTKYDIIDNIMKLEEKTYDDARAHYDKEFSQANTILASVNKDETAEKTRDKANLQVFYNAIQTGGLNPNALTPEQKTTIRELEVKNGLPAGTFTALQARNPKARIVSQSSSNGGKSTTFVMQSPGGQIYTQDVGHGLASSAPYTAAQMKKLVADINGVFNDRTKKANGYAVRGADNYVDPDVYLNLYQNWSERKLSDQDFVKNFPATKLVNPASYSKLPTNIRPATKKGSGRTS
jgi:hypothetical protein